MVIPLIYREILKYSDFKVQSHQGDNWTHRIFINNIPDLLKIKFRHRTIGINEVVFDIDSHNKDLFDEIESEISINLQKDNLTHFSFFTSRSPHIHCFFKNMNLYPQEVRRLIRYFILNHYSKEYFPSIDKGLVSENRLIRDFGSIHEITNKPNLLVYECWNTFKTLLNPIPDIILKKVYEHLNQEIKEPAKALNKVSNLEGQQQHMQLVTFVASHRFDMQGMYKNGRLYKNVAIAVYTLGYTLYEVKALSEQMARNCRGHKPNELVKWWEWIQKHKTYKWRVNWEEMKTYGFRSIQANSV